MKTNTTTPTSFEYAIQQLRKTVAKARTSTIGDVIYDKITKEYYGSYIKTPYLPDPAPEEPVESERVKGYWHITEDGSPLPPECKQTPSEYLAPVADLIPKQPNQQTEHKSKAGKKPQVINNPLATALSTLRLEGRSTPWLDDFAFGAICTGPGVINGKHSVALADVKRLLHLPELSVATAAEHLLNHDREPMGPRQLQRVIEAARTALRGIALHLERNPQILRTVDADIDFDKFWATNDDQTKPATPAQHSKKQQALEMIRAGIPTKTTAKELGISKNTVKKWDREAQAAGGVAGGVNDR
ncbi:MULTISPECIES: helix-turn-helix domain-containing protein [unclassified Pseudomonas]|uniref:Helix-turn-helix domain-containing protein n=1 Tax=Pseudomonas sp. MYb327 TaxID=2745230 RepID=A0AAU8DZ58_9PSED